MGKTRDVSPLNPSGPAEILRAEQKDEESCERINRQLSEFLLKSKGISIDGPVIINIIAVRPSGATSDFLNAGSDYKDDLIKK